MKRCSICAHRERTKIEALRASGISLAPIAKQFGVDKSQLSRHMTGHVTAAEMSAYLCGTADVEKLRLIAAEQNGSILEDLQLLKAMTFKQIHEAATVKDASRFSTLAGKMLDILESLGRRTGEISKLNPVLNLTMNNNNFSVLNHPSFLDLQNGLLAIGRAYPAALPDIITLIERLDPPPAARTVPMIEAEAGYAA